MIKNGLLLMIISALFLLFSACSDDDDNGLSDDGNPPEIQFAEDRDSYRPDHGEVRGSDTDHTHVRFSVWDQAGIDEIHVGMGSQFLGQPNQGFEMLDVLDVYSSSASDENFVIEQGAKSVNVDGFHTDIYWEGSTSRVNGNVIAGPYDFTISARDVFGNITTGDQIVTNRFYINRPYAPEIEITNLHDGEIDGEGGQALTVEGTISKGEGDSAGDLAFVWIRLVDEDLHDDFNPAQVGQGLESVWGQSLRIDVTSGDLPNHTVLNLEDILTGDHIIVLPEGHGHYDLIIWAEDEHGNVTRTVVEVHVD